MTARQRFAQNLKNLRLNRKLTQQQVADAMLFKRSSYSGYENGTAEPSLDGLKDIASFFQTSIDTLLLRETLLDRQGLFIKQTKTNHETTASRTICSLG